MPSTWMDIHHLFFSDCRLDSRPELLFILRGVDPSELVSAQLKVDTAIATGQLEDVELADIFGIDLEDASEKTVSPKSSAQKADKPEKAKLTKVSSEKPKKTKKTLNLNHLTGNDLLKYRTKLGFNVTEFANTLGVTSASIYRWERSLNVIKLRTKSKNALIRLLQND